VHESECVALIGPGERNTLQQQLDGNRAGLPAFSDGLDNLGRNIGQSQESTDVRGRSGRGGWKESVIPCDCMTGRLGS
jgi:hypothetical protein